MKPDDLYLWEIAAENDDLRRQVEGLRRLVQKRNAFAQEVALQRKFGGKRRRQKVLPRQLSPKALAVQYANELRTMFRIAHEVYRPLIEAIVGTVRTDTVDKKKPKKPARGADFSKDVKKALGERTPKTKGGEFPKKIRMQARDAQRFLDAAEQRLNNAVSMREVENLAGKFAARTSAYQRAQLSKQVRAALGADPFVRDPVLSGLTEDFVAHNVSLIKRIPKRLHEKVEGMVMNSVAKSELNIDLADEIAEEFGIAERHATLIARDQIAKYYGAVNKARQTEMGVNKFIWRTVNDERVRDTHAELEGEEFSWDDLPTNDAGESIYPGSEIQCRCSAEPVLDDLLDDVDKAESELDGVSGDFLEMLEQSE